MPGLVAILKSSFLPAVAMTVVVGVSYLIQVRVFNKDTSGFWVETCVMFTSVLVHLIVAAAAHNLKRQLRKF